MEPSELLRYCIGVLERLQEPYFVTGSVASTYYGEPRFTNDIDLVLALPMRQVASLCRGFPSPEFYLSDDAVREAILRHGQFNIIHPESGLKIDVIVPEDTPFNRSRFARARPVRPAPDYQARFAAPEDVILKKLEFFREGASEKHLRDIAGILKINDEDIDRNYLDEWVERLELQAIWEEVQRKIAP